MGARVIDTNVLIDLWHGRGPSRRPVRSEETARAAATEWLRQYPRDVLVTPVRLEFVGGVRDREELRLADLFLSHFKLLDAGRMLPEDWVLAERFARRVRSNGRARGAIDCLILALCERLHAELYTRDGGMSAH